MKKIIISLAVLMSVGVASSAYADPEDDKLTSWVPITDENCIEPRTTNIAVQDCYENCDPNRHGFSFSEIDCKARNGGRRRMRWEQFGIHDRMVAEKEETDRKAALLVVVQPCVDYAAKSCRGIVASRTNCEKVVHCHTQEGRVHCEIEWDCDETYRIICSGKVPSKCKVYHNSWSSDPNHMVCELGEAKVDCYGNGK